MKDDRKKISVTKYVLLHVLFVIYSMMSVVSKTISDAEFLSPKFILGYGLIFLILGVYAIGWQQMLKVFSLSEAFANKAIVVIWGIVWGFLIFHEQITLTKIIGSVLIIIGICIFAREEKEGAEHE